MEKVKQASKRRRANRLRRQQIRAEYNISGDIHAVGQEVCELMAAPGQPEEGYAKFAMVGYTGGKMRPQGFKHDIVVDLAGMKIPPRGAPILKNHEFGAIVGHTEQISVINGSLHATGIVSGVGATAEEVTQTSRRGFPWQASIGATIVQSTFVKPGSKVSVNGGTFEGPFHLVSKSRLGEISFVPLGADDQTSALVASGSLDTESEMNPEFVAFLAAMDLDASTLSERAIEHFTKQFEASQAADEEEETSESLAATADNPVALMRQESLRIAKIESVTEGHPKIRASAIEEGWTSERAELEVLRAARKAGPTVSVETPQDAQESQIIEASMLLQVGAGRKTLAGTYSEEVLNRATEKRYQKYTLQRLFRRVLASSGETQGHFGDDTIRAALRADQQMEIRANSGFSTISLTGILSNIANKMMLDAYSAVASVANLICSEATHRDFKEHTKYRMTGTGVMLKVGPGGEIKHFELTEEEYANRVETYARMITLTRQMIINDDLNAFSQIPRIIGRQAALSLEEAVFTLILSNPSAFFHANNDNLLTGAGSALSITSLTTAEQAFLDQVDSDGKPILLRPAILLVPTSLSVVAKQLMTDTQQIGQGAVEPPVLSGNPHVGKWTVVVSPYLNAQGLTGSSATAWYLIANPADAAFCEIAYLSGNRTPTLDSSETDFNTLGMSWRGVFDFGVAMQDHRGAIKSDGA